MQQHTFSRGWRFRTGLLAGLVAGIVATCLMLFLNVALNGISLPQVLSSALTQLIPPSGFDFLFRTVGSNAKHYLFYSIFVGQCLVFALCGGFCALIVAGRTPRLMRTRLQAKADEPGSPQEQVSWVSGLVLAVVLWLAAGLLFLPLTGGGVFGSLLTIGVLSTLVSLAVVGLVFGLLFVYVQNWLVLRRLRKQAGGELNAEEEEHAYERRKFLQRGIIGLGLGVVGVLAWKFIGGGLSGAGSASSSPNLVQGFKSKITPPPKPNYAANFPTVPQLSSEVTSNDQYYVVSKNVFSDPSVNASGWHLAVDGEVEHAYSMSYNDLLAMPMQKQYESMMCISNEVGGEYMSNGLWEGVRLKDLLARAGTIKPGATKVVVYAADDYADSIHLSKALEDTTLVAVRMNGQTLPQGHGYPARLLVPGIYGMKHVKWMTHIQVVSTDYQGYWQQRGWSDAAPIRLTSRIDTPLDGTTFKAGTPTYVAGVAFSGNQGISEVDVSFDNGQSWQQAMLKKPLSALTWVLWEVPWQPAKGTYTILVRAVDLAGNVQVPYIAPPLPDGSSGYHSIAVTVS